MIGFSRQRWFSGAHNWSRWGIRFRRIYVLGHWTPFIAWWPHRLKNVPQKAAEGQRGVDRE